MKRSERKKKEQQAMTAAQRKAKRDGNKPTTPEEVISEKRRNYRGIVILAAAIVLIIIIVVGVVIPVWYINDYRYEDNPIAVIKLSNGMELRYKVNISEAHNVSTNFLFLASIGYFDDSIIYDTSDDWVMFGGYRLNEDQTKLVHRSEDESFQEKTKEYFTDNVGAKQFRYRVNKDTATKMTVNDAGAKYGLFGNYSRYCTEFEIMGEVGAAVVNSNIVVSGITYYQQHFAWAYDDTTKENIDTILGLENALAYGSKFASPKETIKIVSTSVHNYDSPISGNFETYMTDSSSISSSWTGTYPR